jgi:hypothetical protein
MAWLQSWIWVFELALLPSLCLRFPNGKLVSRAWRGVELGPLCWLGAFVAFAIALWPHSNKRLLENIQTVGVAQLATIEDILFILFPLVMICLVRSSP